MGKNKVVKEVVKISLGLQDNLYLGNLDATRNWGHLPCYGLYTKYDKTNFKYLY